MIHFAAERPVVIQQLHNRLKTIYATLYAERRAIGKIEYVVTGQGKGPEAIPKQGWEPFPENCRWGGFDQTTWFRVKVTVPKEWQGETVVALVRTAEWSLIPGSTGLTEGGEALAYVDGVPRQGIDRNRDEILLAEKAKGGEKFELVFEACPSTRYDLHHLFGYAEIAIRRALPWEFYWDALVPLQACETLDPNWAPARKLLEVVNEAVKRVALQHVDARKHPSFDPQPPTRWFCEVLDEEAYLESLKKAQRFLRKELKAFATSEGMGSLTLAGHAHIDTAWLWPLRETQRKCSRTFSTILRLMERYPEFHFSCSQPVQYTWMKEHYPTIFEGIKKRVKEGRWELCGAPWVEPDHNMPSGEALIRQYLYGNRWFDREFGQRSRVAWVPDSFGYPYQLPQIMKMCQLSSFITTKIDWSQYTKFPYSMFMWEGADGTRIPAVMPPLNYNGNPTPADCREQWNRFQQKERVDELPFPFGYGDGGGGPTAGQIETGRRLENLAGVPKCTFGRLEDCVERMVKKTDRNKLPVWNGELYLEYHRACQTSQARTKQNNRLSELLLRNAELFNSLAHLHGGTYDNDNLYAAWLTVLTYQFHDILPGSSLTEVYTQGEQDYAEAREHIVAADKQALVHLIKKIDTAGEGTPLVVFNTTPWVRTEAATVPVELPNEPFSVLDPRGEVVPHQRLDDETLLFEARDVPPMGWAVYRLARRREEAQAGMLEVTQTRLENEYLRVQLDKNGQLTSVYDKFEDREVLAPGARGNVFQLFDDRPHLHDAWDTDFNFEETMWEFEPAESVEVVEKGPVRVAVRVVRKTKRSTLQQDIVLYAHSPRIDFMTKVDWHEKQTLFKVAFPVDVRSTRATYEIQYGAIERPTHSNRDADRAQFEVAAQRWADLSEGDYGVSLLNDCKYSYDVRGNTLRLSLMRSPIDPDPQADEGEHTFTYSLYPHAYDWRNGTVTQAYELNVPLITVESPPIKGALPPVYSFVSVDSEHVVLDTVKKHEDSAALILRLYESHGQRGDCTLTFAQKPTKVTECDGMEENDTPVKFTGNAFTIYVTPYQVRTFKVTFK